MPDVGKPRLSCRCDYTWSAEWNPTHTWLWLFEIYFLAFGQCANLFLSCLFFPDSRSKIISSASQPAPFSDLSLNSREMQEVCGYEFLIKFKRFFLPVSLILLHLSFLMALSYLPLTNSSSGMYGYFYCLNLWIYFYLIYLFIYLLPGKSENAVQEIRVFKIFVSFLSAFFFFRKNPSAIQRKI